MYKFLMQGLFIGIIFGVPAGTIGAITIHRSLKYGFKAGFITGLGSTVADVIYAFVCVLGISLIQEFIQKWRLPISIIGGILIIYMGISVFRNKSDTKIEEGSMKKYPLLFFSSLIIALCNPATILSFLAVFTMLNIEAGLHTIDAIGLTVGIGLGTCFWWIVLSGIATKVRYSMTKCVIGRIYRIMGCLLCIFGMAIMVRGMLR